MTEVTTLELIYDFYKKYLSGIALVAVVALSILLVISKIHTAGDHTEINTLNDRINKMIATAAVNEVTIQQQKTLILDNNLTITRLGNDKIDLENNINLADAKIDTIDRDTTLFAKNIRDTKVSSTCPGSFKFLYDSYKNLSKDWSASK
jgi:hypothetical protein